LGCGWGGWVGRVGGVEGGVGWGVVVERCAVGVGERHGLRDKGAPSLEYTKGSKLKPLLCMGILEGKR